MDVFAVNLFAPPQDHPHRPPPDPGDRSFADVFHDIGRGIPDELPAAHHRVRPADRSLPSQNQSHSNANVPQTPEAGQGTQPELPATAAETAVVAVAKTGGAPSQLPTPGIEHPVITPEILQLVETARALPGNAPTQGQPQTVAALVAHAQTIGQAATGTTPDVLPGTAAPTQAAATPGTPATTPATQRATNGSPSTASPASALAQAAITLRAQPSQAGTTTTVTPEPTVLHEIARQLRAQGIDPEQLTSQRPEAVEAVIETATLLGGSDHATTVAAAVTALRDLAGQIGPRAQATPAAAIVPEVAAPQSAAPQSTAPTASPQPTTPQAGIDPAPVPPAQPANGDRPVQQATPANAANPTNPTPADPSALSQTTGPARAEETALRTAPTDRPLGLAPTANPKAGQQTNNGGTAANRPDGQPVPTAPNGQQPDHAAAGAKPDTGQARAALTTAFGTMVATQASAGRSHGGDPLPVSDPTAPTNSGLSGLGETAKPTPQSAHAAQQAARPMPPAMPVAEQVAVRIGQAIADGVQRLNIQLHPRELGRIEVRLDVSESGRLSATIVVERPDTLELLQKDSRDLERALQQAGLDADHDSLDFNLKEQDPEAEDSQMADQADDGEPDMAADDDIVLDPGDVELVSVSDVDDGTVNIEV